MKTDFKKTLNAYRARAGEFRVLEVPPTRYLAVDGQGDPNVSPAYAAALEALYPVAYTVKFASKQALGRDYVVPPLEALWWADDMDAFTAARDKARWSWTAMLMLPGWIDDEHVAAATVKVAAGRAPEAHLARAAPHDPAAAGRTGAVRLRRRRRAAPRAPAPGCRGR